jgi:hypothetical protein
MRLPIPPLLAVVFAICLALLLSSLPACGASALEQAQTTISATATAVVVVDQETAEIYTAHAQAALDRAATMAEYMDAMRPLDDVEGALRFARKSLLSAQAALDAWRETDNWHDFAAAIPCVTASLRHLAEALNDAGVEPPPEIGRAVALAEAFGGACTEPPVLETTARTLHTRVRT